MMSHIPLAGKLLYEFRIESVKKFTDTTLKPWDQLPDEAKLSWQDTAERLHRKWFGATTARVNELEARAVESSWRENPDRSGGAFSQDEVDRSKEWR